MELGGRGKAAPLVYVLVRRCGEQGASRSEVLGRALWIRDSDSLGFLLSSCVLVGNKQPSRSDVQPRAQAANSILYQNVILVSCLRTVPTNREVFLRGLSPCGKSRS